jgi:CspA family cold shock protein
MTGKVKWFNASKGYGFINRGEGNDIFVHYSQIVYDGYKTLQEGQEVEFELLETELGPQAQKVVAIAK